MVGEVKKINFKLLLGSLVASAFMILIINLIAFAIFSVPELLEAFNNAMGIVGNMKGYTFNLTRNSILLVIMTIIFYYSMGE
jgi:hypothetical protein